MLLAASAAFLVLLAGGAWLFYRAFFVESETHSAGTTLAAASASAEPVARPTGVTPEVRGRVLDPEGNPVSGANVRLVAPGPPFTVSREATSDPDGAFSFERLRPGRALVVADRESAGFATSAVLEVAQGESTDVTLVLSSTSGVRGTVVDDKRHPIEGATLSIEGMPWSVPGARSNPLGAFRLVVVPNEATALVAKADGYEPARVVLKDRQPGAELVVTVQLVGVNDAAAQGAPGSVEGVVVDEKDAPVAKFSIVVQLVEPGQVRRTAIGGARAFDDPRGTFRIDGLAPGSYVLIAQGPSGQPIKRSEPVSVESGGVTRGVKIVLGQGGTVMGRVIDRQRQPVAGADVFLDANGADASATLAIQSNAEGKFRVEDFPAGALTIRVEKAGFRQRKTSGLQVRAGGTLNKDVVLFPATREAP
jgi:hypothetical protein